MDGQRFDAIVRLVTSSQSRRDTFRLLMTSIAATVGLTQVREAAAECLENGEPCNPKASPNGCCSGKCSRKRKKCRPAFNQGTCTVEDNFCTQSGNYDCGSGCLCRVTIDGRSFCSEGNDGQDCTTHRECEQRFGKGARCAPKGDICSGGGPGNECTLKCSTLN